MKKTCVLLLFIIFLSFCSVFKSKVLPYPEGIVFPVERADEIVYEGEIINRIVRKEERLYFATRAGFVYCLDGKDYTLQWRLRMQEEIAGPVYMGKSQFYILDQKNSVHCFDMEGNPRWQVAVQEEITSSLEEIGPMVFLGTSQGSFIALHINSGVEAWHFAAQDAIRSNPVASDGLIIFGCDDHSIYFLDQEGNQVDTYALEDKIRDTLLVDGKFLYFGTENNFFFCLDLKRRMQKWKVRTGGRVLPVPVSDNKRVYFVAWNNVLYCLHKRNGSILWWGPIPSRSIYPLEIVEDKIVVSSMSSTLVCFDIDSGVRVGNMDVGMEVRSNPLWNPPHLLVNVYERQTEGGKIILMKKVVQTTLTPSVTSPRLVNEEIAFTAASVGFHLPQYEFYIEQGEEKRVVQPESDKSTWSWFPSLPGSYTVGVTVRDERQERDVEVPFVIIRIKPRIALYASRPSPQGLGEKIVFTASASGLVNPQYTVQIAPVIWAMIGRRYSIALKSGSQEEVIRGKPGLNEWTWIPENLGLFRIHVVASDENEKTNSLRLYKILDKKDLEKIKKIKKEGVL